MQASNDAGTCSYMWLLKRLKHTQGMAAGRSGGQGFDMSTVVALAAKSVESRAEQGMARESEADKRQRQANESRARRKSVRVGDAAIPTAGTAVGTWQMTSRDVEDAFKLVKSGEIGEGEAGNSSMRRGTGAVRCEIASSRNGRVSVR